MIDWVTLKIDFPHQPIESGQVMFISSDGELDKFFHRRSTVEGSHGKAIAVRSIGGDGQGGAEQLSISGNPSKFLQGHNIFGSDNLLSLVYDTVKIIDRELKLQIDVFTYKKILKGEYEISMIDINYSYGLNCQKEVLAWIHAAEYTSRTRAGRPTSYPGTIYWGQKSRRWAIKAYSKFAELQSTKQHRLPIQLQNTDLLAWTENILRIELRLLKTELIDLKLTTAKKLAKKIPELFAEYQKKIIMTTQTILTDNKLFDLPQSLMSTYVLWNEGHCLPQIMSKATYYRHRTALLEFGVDISVSKPRDKDFNVVPLMRILEAKPVAIPAWAFEQGLVHDSASNF